MQLITFSAELMIPCSLPLSLALAAAYYMVMEKVKMNSNPTFINRMAV